MEYFLLALASLLFGLAKAVWLALAGVITWLLRLFWPLWLVAVLVLALGTACTPAQAGWLDWLWGGSQADIEKIERSAELAQEAARVTSEAARSQAQQAVAQAEQAAAQAQQNSRVADLLGELSQERQHLAEHVAALNTLELQDSQVAAALSAAGPLLICVTSLLVGSLALWLTSGSSNSQNADLATAVDVMAEELAVSAQVAQDAGLRLGGPGNSAGLLGLPDASPGPDRRRKSYDPALDPNPNPSRAAGFLDAGTDDEGPMPF